MNVKDFIAETLKQVSEAVEENSTTYKHHNRQQDTLQQMNMFKHNDGFVTYVDFDIAVTDMSSKDGGAKLNVVGVGSLGGDLKESTQVASKIKFRVPLNLKAK